MKKTKPKNQAADITDEEAKRIAKKLANLAGVTPVDDETEALEKITAFISKHHDKIFEDVDIIDEIACNTSQSKQLLVTITKNLDTARKTFANAKPITDEKLAYTTSNNLAVLLLEALPISKQLMDLI
jgi:hypothetical protein